MFDFTAFAQDVRVILLELSERLRDGLEDGKGDRHAQEEVVTTRGNEWVKIQTFFLENAAAAGRVHACSLPASASNVSSPL
jgi:hypothetical protein